LPLESQNRLRALRKEVALLLRYKIQIFLLSFSGFFEVTDWYSEKIYSQELNKFSDNFNVIKLISFESIISFINLELPFHYIINFQHGSSKVNFSTVI